MALNDKDDRTSPNRELEQIRSALDQSAIVAITDHAGTITHVNDNFCTISKYARSELLGKNHRIINSGFHGSEFFIDLWKTISSGKTWSGEIRNRAKDGSFYWVHTTITSFSEPGKAPHAYISIRYDITQRKKAEEQLRVYADKLELNNIELQTSINAIKEREAQILVQDRLASIGLLASSLAHEIGTPLGVIRGRAEYLEMQVGEEKVKKTVEIIITQIDRVSKLIRSLLNLARGERIQHSGKISLYEVVTEVIELLAHEFRKNNIEVRNELNPEPPVEVKAESGPLHQVLLNLFINSVHAIDSAKKVGRTDNHYIHISREDSEKHIILKIADTGCGISPENMKNLFKPFFTTKEIGVGTGLGLATSYRIMESWGGSIQVKSEEGNGSEFRILFPKTLV